MGKNFAKIDKKWPENGTSACFREIWTTSLDLFPTKTPQWSITSENSAFAREKRVSIIVDAPNCGNLNSFQKSNGGHLTSKTYVNYQKKFFFEYTNEIKFFSLKYWR